MTFNYSELKKLKKILPSLLNIIKKYEGKKQKKKPETPDEMEGGCDSPYNTTPESSDIESE